MATKSGTTIETLSFYRYVWQKAREVLGKATGDRFIAITDPGMAVLDFVGAQIRRT